MEANVPAVEKANVWGLVGLKKGEKRAPHKILTDLHKSVKPIDTPDAISDARAARRLAFRSVKRQLTLWKGPVYRNRLADQLIFPLKDNSIAISDSADLQSKKCDLYLAEAKRKHESLPGKLYNALYHERNVSTNNTDSPGMQIRKKLLENISARQKERYILARAVAKNKRQNKIKSKNFHRHMKRRTLKEFEASMEKLRDNNPKAFAEQIFRAEVNRAKERASLRHRGGSKFERMQKLRAKYDTEARNAVAQMHEQSKELTKRIDSKDSSESEDSDIDVTSESESDSDETEPPEDGTDDGEQRAQTIDSLMWWRINNDSELKHISKRTKTKSVVLSTLAAEEMLENCSQSKVLNSKSAISVEEKTDNLDPIGDLFYKAIEENSAVDAGVQERFAQEKSEVVDEENPKDIDTFIPGWNSWTGPGLESQEEELRKKHRIPAPKATRDDRDKPHVLIRHRVNSEFKQHLVKSIPFPFNTPDQFDAFISQPVSREWLTESAHHELTRPKVTVQSGRIIRPISKSAALLRDKDVERFAKQTKRV